jgi:membrane fusion protein, adhesin transport system
MSFLSFQDERSYYPIEKAIRPRFFSHLIIFATLGFFITAIAWANYASLDEVTIGIGKVIPSSQIQIVQNLEGGILSELNIREGDEVKKGQVILHIDDKQFASSFRKNQVSEHVFKAIISRLSAEANGEEFSPSDELKNTLGNVLRDEMALYQSRQKKLLSTISVFNKKLDQKSQSLIEKRSELTQLRKSLVLAKKELTITQPMVKSGVISEVEFLRIQRQINDIEGKVQAVRLAIPRAKSAISEVRHKINETRETFKSDALTELNQFKQELAEASESSLALEDRVKRRSVRSPVHGIVKKIVTTTVGGIIQPGADLVEIVPLDDTLLIEAKIRPADIAFIRAEQKAVVKITAYDFSIFGGLDSKVVHISADTIEDKEGESFYLIRVRTDKNFIGSSEGSLPIIPGMHASIDILTGKKTVMQYLLKPLRRAREKALRER